MPNLLNPDDALTNVEIAYEDATSTISFRLDKQTYTTMRTLLEKADKGELGTLEILSLMRELSMLLHRYSQLKQGETKQ